LETKGGEEREEARKRGAGGQEEEEPAEPSAHFTEAVEISLNESNVTNPVQTNDTNGSETSDNTDPKKSNPLGTTNETNETTTETKEPIAIGSAAVEEEGNEGTMDIPVITEESPDDVPPETADPFSPASSFFRPPSLGEVPVVPPVSSSAQTQRKRASSSLKKHWGRDKDKRHPVLSPVPMLDVRTKIYTLHPLPFLEHRVPVIKIRTSHK
jgi:hypothetical protein